MSDGAQYVTRDGLLYDGGKRAADAEWLAAILKQDAQCSSSLDTVVFYAMRPGEMAVPPGECPGCAPLRALLKRALDVQGPAPRPPRET